MDVKKSAKIVLLGLVVLSVIFLLNQFNFSNYFPIKTVRIYGANQIDHQKLQTMLLPLVDRGFFTINVESIKDRLLQIPWVSDIFVRRVWPDQMDIVVVEKKPMAHWNRQSLLSATGELFSLPHATYLSSLPEFVGPDGKQIIMLQYFNDINRLLMPLHVKIIRLELTPFFSWKLMLDNGMILQIGHKDILTRLTHFVKVYPQIIGDRVKDVEYIDLRYANGIAVRWKSAIKI